MAEAWTKGMSTPKQFRENLSSDLDFVQEYEIQLIKKQNEEIRKAEHEMEVQAAMDKIRI